MANGQRHALRWFGLAHLVQPGVVDPAAYLVAAYRESGPVCAGLRLHPRRAAHPLPLQLAVAIPAGVVLKLDQLKPRGLAELCALWVSADVEDKHLAVRMLRFRYIHDKFVLIDPLAAKPIVVTGTANFSKNSQVCHHR